MTSDHVIAELQDTLLSFKMTIMAMVAQCGGELVVTEQSRRSVGQYDTLEIVEDKANRCHVMRLKRSGNGSVTQK